jgi:hypothetical protein
MIGVEIFKTFKTSVASGVLVPAIRRRICCVAQSGVSKPQEE